MIEKILQFVAAMFLVALFSFLAGTVVGKYEIFPFQYISQIKEAVSSLVSTGGIYPKNLVLVRDEGDDRPQVKVLSSAQDLEGYVAVMGFDSISGGYAVTLLNSSRQPIHRWAIDYLALDSDGPSGKTDQPHGLNIRKDGSIIVNFDQGDVMARLGYCGDLVWLQEGNFHHAIGHGLNDTLWTWSSEYDAYSPFQYLVNFDPETGEVLRSIGLVEDIIQKSQSAALQMTIPHGYDFDRANVSDDNDLKDIFHPNDIEALSEDMAEQFPMLNAGDLLLSLRELHMVVIVDPETGDIKWLERGPWRFQHDPDFNQDGTISVYSNNTYREKSSIISIDPTTMKSKELLIQGDAEFYSGYLGKHTILPNGNVLFLSAGEGRVVEASSDGNVLFEYLNVVSDKLLGHLQNAIWLPEGYFDELPECEN